MNEQMNAKKSIKDRPYSHTHTQSEKQLKPHIHGNKNLWSTSPHSALKPQAPSCYVFRTFGEKAVWCFCC